ncbi:MAG: Gfo/Idh/MocA family protein [Paracoccus sp. (in: a-proteobacteria)]
MSLAIGLVGLGAMARAQHLPAIAATGGVHLAAIASRNASLPDCPSYPDLAAMLAAEPGLAAVSLCTPPQGRFDQAMQVLRAGRHLMLEKPPAATLTEAEILRDEAGRRGLTIFATWHSREGRAVDAARRWLSVRKVRQVRIDWREDVRKWHPGQDWIWQPGGLGVFDPGINALSLLTTLMADPVILRAAGLDIPEGRQTPIAAQLALSAGAVAIEAEFDWREQGGETWQVGFETTNGTACLRDGGAVFEADGKPAIGGEDVEYRRLYEGFRDLVADGRSAVDLAPLRLVADAFLCGRRRLVAPFDETGHG